MLQNLLGIRLGLKMGKGRPTPVSYDIITALTTVEVTDNAVERDTFQMTFTMGKRQPNDYTLLRTGLFQPKTRVAIILQIGARNIPLIAGVISHFQLNPSNTIGMTTFSVTGEGIDLLLDLEERNDKYERHSDTMIIQKLINTYASYGLNLEVADEANNLQQPDNNRLIPRQYSTDQEYIQQLSERNGYVFYADPLENGDMKFYWGPERRKGKVQTPLTMNMGPATNVTRLDFTQDSRTPVTAKGSRLQTDDDNTSDAAISPEPYDVDDLASTEYSLDRIQLTRDTAKYDTNRASIQARQLMKAKYSAVSATGEVDTVRYGQILQAGKLVAVRGAGTLYNGDYYIKKVTHHIEHSKSTQQYTQSFTLEREGLGAKKNRE